MAWYEKKWWKKLLGRGSEEAKKIDTLSNIEAISEYLSESRNDVKVLLKELEKLEELEKEHQVAKPGIIHINLETQAKIIEQLLQRYEFYQNDVDVNGLRVKLIANEFLKRAEKAGLKDLVKEKKKDQKWLMKW